MLTTGVSNTEGPNEEETANPASVSSQIPGASNRQGPIKSLAPISRPKSIQSSSDGESEFEFSPSFQQPCDSPRIHLN